MKRKKVLKKLHHKFLVSCCNHEAGLFEVYIHPLGISIRKLMHGDIRGIVKVPDGYIVAQNAGKLTYVNKLFQIVHEVNLGEIDLHGMTVDEDCLYVVETKHNTIGIYDRNRLKRLDEIRLSLENEDTIHVNDITIKDGILYASMFSERSHWRKSKLNSGLIQAISLTNPEERKIIQKGLIHPHSVMFDGDDLWYCESSRCQVAKYPDFAIQMGGFVRGLAKKGDYIFVGLSESRNNDRVVSHPCGINIISLREKENVFIRIPAQEVYGILLLEASD